MDFEVVTVTNGWSEYLEYTISSVISQDSKKFKYLIVNGSKDKIENYLCKEIINSRIINIFNIPDNGIWEGFNNSIQLLSGKWVLYMNS